MQDFFIYILVAIAIVVILACGIACKKKKCYKNEHNMQTVTTVPTTNEPVRIYFISPSRRQGRRVDLISQGQGQNAQWSSVQPETLHTYGNRHANPTFTPDTHAVPPSTSDLGTEQRDTSDLPPNYNDVVSNPYKYV